jgi:hypothetical protein
MCFALFWLGVAGRIEAEEDPRSDGWGSVATGV